MPKLSLGDYLVAIEILSNDCLYGIDPCDIYEQPENIFPLHSTIPSPELLVIKKEAYENLSEEAKEIITTILDAPAEILTPNMKMVTKKSVRKYFRKLWMSKFITDTAIKEIKSWVSQL